VPNTHYAFLRTHVPTERKIRHIYVNISRPRALYYIQFAVDCVVNNVLWFLRYLIQADVPEGIQGNFDNSGVET
jgi:IS4 transposase